MSCHSLSIPSVPDVALESLFQRETTLNSSGGFLGGALIPEFCKRYVQGGKAVATLSGAQAPDSRLRAIDGFSNIGIGQTKPAEIAKNFLNSIHSRNYTRMNNLINTRTDEYLLGSVYIGAHWSVSVALVGVPLMSAVRAIILRK